MTPPENLLTTAAQHAASPSLVYPVRVSSLPSLQRRKIRLQQPPTSPGNVPRGTFPGHFLWPTPFLNPKSCVIIGRRPVLRSKITRNRRKRRGKSHRNRKPEGRRGQNHHRRQSERLRGVAGQKSPGGGPGPPGQHHLRLRRAQKQAGVRHLHLPDGRRRCAGRHPQDRVQHRPAALQHPAGGRGRGTGQHPPPRNAAAHRAGPRGAPLRLHLHRLPALAGPAHHQRPVRLRHRAHPSAVRVLLPGGSHRTDEHPQNRAQEVQPLPGH